MCSGNTLLTQLLKSGEYSDFSLVCEGQQFPLHRAVVCPQSPVISAAVNGQFKESITKELVVENFNVQTVKRFIAALYGSDYEAEECDNELSLEDHVEMHKIADYYDVASLKDLSYTKIQAILQECFISGSFVSLLKNTEVARDEKLTAAFAAKAALHICQLVEMDEFAELITDPMILNILKESAKLQHNMTVTIAIQNKEHREELQSAQSQLSYARDSFSRCVQVLQRYASCRHCGENFSCYFEKGGPDSYTLRCSDCTTRHMN